MNEFPTKLEQPELITIRTNTSGYFVGDKIIFQDSIFEVLEVLAGYLKIIAPIASSLNLDNDKEMEKYSRLRNSKERRHGRRN